MDGHTVPGRLPRSVIVEGPTFFQSAILMDTLVRIEVPSGTMEASGPTVARAFQWFQEVEEVCSRFEESSEVMELVRHPGVPQVVSPLLFEAVRFALRVAEASGGAFDPTVGHTLEQRGFNRNYRTGERVSTEIDTDRSVSYRDIHLDLDSRAITLREPLIIDLGAVAKGLAIDLAARELRPLGNFAINAGGDIYVGGSNLRGEPWRVGIRHPRRDGELLTSVQISDRAVCTSGDYERAVDGENHLVDPRTATSASAVCSVTVIAPTAMAADALGTAAFVLGLDAGVQFLRRQGAQGLLVSDSLVQRSTPGFRRYQVQ